MYDSENGTTCHQCRQKTIETKAKCTKCTLYFCPKWVAALGACVRVLPRLLPAGVVTWRDDKDRACCSRMGGQCCAAPWPELR